MPILKEYDKVIRDQEARGMMENVSADDTDIRKIHIFWVALVTAV